MTLTCVHDSAFHRALYVLSDGSSVDWGYYATVVGLGMEPESTFVNSDTVSLTIRDVGADAVTAAFKAADRTAPAPAEAPAYSIQVQPNYTEACLAVPEIAAQVEAYVDSHRKWTPAMDARLIQWIQDRVATRPGLNTLSADWVDLIPDLPDAAASASPAQVRNMWMFRMIVQYCL